MRKYTLFLLAIGAMVTRASPPTPHPSLLHPPKSRTIAAVCKIGEKLEQAFPNTDIAKAPIRLAWPSKGLIIAADRSSIEADGRLRLSGCAIAHFGKEPAGAHSSQPTTVKSQYAYLKLDHLIETASGLTRHKLLAVELEGGMRLSFED